VSHMKSRLSRSAPASCRRRASGYGGDGGVARGWCDCQSCATRCRGVVCMLDCQRESRHGVVAAAKQRPRKHLRRIQVKLLKKKGKAASTMAE
jgi:hypothetical protein